MDRGVIIFTELAFGSIMFFVTDTFRHLEKKYSDSASQEELWEELRKLLEIL